MDCSPPGSLSMGFPRQEYCSVLPFSSPGDCPDPAIKPESTVSSCIGRWILYPLGKLSMLYVLCNL